MDVFSMTIPNKISLLLIAAFCGLAPAAGLTLEAFAWHIAAGGLVLVITATMFFMGMLGGGDAKLLSVVALWMGFDFLMDFLLYASLFGGLLAVLYVKFRARPLPKRLQGEVWAERLHTPKNGIPYGVALAASALLVYPATPWFIAIGA
jgi:prepilin peptidase CpaA